MVLLLFNISFGGDIIKKHILIEKAYKYKDSSNSLIMGKCSYDIKNGYWIINKANEILMLSDKPIKPMTKKADRETGEDQKGE